MRELLEGSHAVSSAVAMARPGVICAYPISPQTHIVEDLSTKVRSGDLKDCTYLNVESEFAALSVAIGSAATGARTYTATASQGLLYMVEALFNASGMELPIVMTVASRAVGAPINIWNDHSDSLSQRDSGWLQLFCADNQEAVDLHIQAFKIAEKLRLPVMVCMDGFVLTHATELVDLPSQQEVDAFLPPADQVYAMLNLEHPISMGTMAGPEYFTETKYLAHEKQLDAVSVVEEVAQEWQSKFGRPAGGRLRVYLESSGDYLPHVVNSGDGIDFAGSAEEVVIVMMGATLGTMQTRLAQLANEGIKVKLVGITSYRPFPDDLLRQVVGKAKTVVVVDRAVQPGIGGVLTNEVDRALRETKAEVKTVLAGLGGRPITEDALVDMARSAASGELTERLTWLSLNEDLIKAAHDRQGDLYGLAKEVK
jgi:pyruvate ferredoxin oxidoreductase alpha subunit